MKNFLTSKAFLPLNALFVVACLLFGTSTNAQITYTENWNAAATLANWTSTGAFTSNFTGATTCGGTGNSIRTNLYSFAPAQTFTSPLTGTSNGQEVTFTFDYKVAVWSANTTGEAATSFIIKPQWGTSPTGPWTDIATIGGPTGAGHVVSGSCATKTYTFTPAIGAQVYVRFDNAWNGAGDYYINFDNVALAQALPPPPTGGAVECLLVCSGNQNVTLAPGACTYQLPNLVTTAGPCMPSVVLGRRTTLNTAPWNFLTYPAFDLLGPGGTVWPGFPPASNTWTINRNTLQTGTPMMNTTGVPTAPTHAVTMRGKDGVGNYAFWTAIRLAAAPYNGTLTFDWVYDTDDGSALWDPFAFQINPLPGILPNLGAAAYITNPNIGDQSGTFSRQMTAGQILELYVWSQDNFGGEARVTISNLRLAEPDVIRPWVVRQTRGPVAGTQLGAGSYEICYELVSPAGQVADDCCFTVNVAGFPTPVRSLACNDHVNISADANCNVTLSADMFLEGGPYGCYNNYRINVWPFNSQANAVNNVPQGVPLALPTGNHTYEIVDPATGNKCWGTFTIEDKLAPVVTCNCQDINVITPVTQLSGSATATSSTFVRCGGFGGPTQYQAWSFQVSASGSYTLNANPSNGDTYGYIYTGSFDPANPCANILAQDDDTAGGADPLLTFNAVVGQTYIAVIAYWGNFGPGVTAPQGAWQFTRTAGPGSILTVTNPSLAPECQFECYELDVVSNETVPMVLRAPGANRSVLTTAPTFSDACGSATPSFEDRITKSNCGASKLVRNWKFVDASGNTSFCSQTFTFNQITVFDLLPPVRDVNLTCGLDASPEAIAAYYDRDTRQPNTGLTNIGAYNDDWAQTPGVTELHEGYRFGYFTYQLPGFMMVPATAPNLHDQKVDNGVCNIYVNYVDQMITACGVGCGGNMKVIRTWTILDWCTGAVFTYIQVIKATDEKAPTFDVKDHTVSVDPWGCAANWTVDQPWELQDNCAKAEELKWGVKVPAGVTISGTQPNYTLSGMPKGRHAITYWAEDCCGNISEKVSFVTVIDASAPVAVAKQNIVMSLTGSGTGADGAGKIYGWQIDNGSYDHCTPVKFEVRRTAGGSCGNIGANNHNNNSTYNHSPADNVPGGVWAHPEDTKDNNVIIDTDGGEFVKFCCEDIPAGAAFGLHEVELRVWDDGNMNGVYGDNAIIDGMRDNYNTTWVTVRVENKLPPVLVCPPNVTVTCDMELNLSIGTDTPVGSVNLTMTGSPKAYDLCSNLDITYKDEWVGQFNDVCKSGTLRRTFKVTKGSVVVTCVQLITVTTITAPFTVTFPQNNATTEWDKCNFELSDARDANNPVIKKPIVNYGQCDIVGENIKIDTFLFEDGACKKWRVEYNYKNWCTGQDLGPFVHWYAFKDEIAPVLVCKDQMFAANPNPQNPNGGCEAQVALEASASDALVCAEESWVKWQMYFDGWANGTVDRLASSFVNKSWNGIWVAQARLLATGAPNPVWAQLQAQHPGLPFADLIYVTYIKPTKASGEVVQIPVGTGPTAFILDAENISHKVLWKVTDGCGNVDQCESTVMVVDKKAPTPYCVSISTALMQSTPKMVELWAKDFDKGAFDNCTPQAKLYFTFEGVAPIYSRINEAHFYKAGAAGAPSVNATATDYAQGKAYRWLPSMRSAGFVWTAAGDYNVNVSVWDEAWNTDFCTVALKVIDNGPGTGSKPSVSGTVNTATGANVNAVTVTFDANVIEYPKSTTTVANGTYSMEHPSGVRYVVSADKGGDYLNGVSTLDLVMIQRHILGMQALDSQYKLIAADANNDGRVTASDLSELRKLILGVTSELPNASWRFPVAGTAVQTSPISFTETIEIANLSANMSGQNFVAVKIGDVNGNVATNVNNDVVEARSNNTVAMTVAEAAVVAGEVVEIPVTASNFADVAGFQYTMNLKGASFVGINSGSIEMNANNVGVLANGNVTMSYATSEAVSANEGDVLFTLVVRANQATTVSEMITLNSAVTKSESYNSDLKVGSVSLNVRTAAVASIELFQNEPNPFRGQTTVSFEMPEAGAATLSVYDMTGKVVVVRNIAATKGLNSEVFTKEQLGVSGVMYYTLESGDFTATKKMIIVE
jgi:hypothetical protein